MLPDPPPLRPAALRRARLCEPVVQTLGVTIDDACPNLVPAVMAAMTARQDRTEHAETMKRTKERSMKELDE
jgi:hypothetical protein